MNNGSGKPSDRRQYVRHEFPPGQRPIAEIEGRECQILDICERGLRIESAPSMILEEGTTVDVTIRLGEGTDFALSGKIIHTQGSHVGIMLSEAIPMDGVLQDS